MTEVRCYLVKKKENIPLESLSLSTMTSSSIPHSLSRLYGKPDTVNSIPSAMSFRRMEVTGAYLEALAFSPFVAQVGLELFAPLASFFLHAGITGMHRFAQKTGDF